MNSQLLCTFTTKENLDIVLSEIVSSYEIIFDKIYVLQNEEQVEELMCTYNVDSTNAVDYNAVENTLLITNNDGLKRINTRIFKIIKTKDIK